MLTNEQIAEERRRSVSECLRIEAWRLIVAGNDPDDVLEEMIMLGLSGSIAMHGPGRALHLGELLTTAAERLRDRLLTDFSTDKPN